MYLRHTIRRKDGKTHRYWGLVRSVRVGRRVIQQTVAHLGELDVQGRLEARELARHLIGAPEQAQLFDDGSRDVTAPVRLKGVRLERGRRFGDVYLALALWRGTGLAELCATLLPEGKERVAPGRRWRPFWSRRGCASRRASCTSPRTGIGARRLAICFSWRTTRSTRIASTARSIGCWSTRRRSKRICPGGLASCSRSTTRCCSMT